MKKVKARWIALLSATVLAVGGLGAAIGATYALYSKQAKVVTHVTIGDLAFAFTRTKLEEHALNDQGYLADLPADETKVDLTNDGSKAFEADNGVPGAYYTATFELENKGATAFNAKVEVPTDFITLDGVEDADKTAVLSKITLSFNGEEAKSLEGDALSYDLGSLAKAEKKTFTMKVDFSSELGNEAQNAVFEFALRLTATQAQ